MERPKATKATEQPWEPEQNEDRGPPASDDTDEDLTLGGLQANWDAWRKRRRLDSYICAFIARSRDDGLQRAVDDPDFVGAVGSIVNDAQAAMAIVDAE